MNARGERRVVFWRTAPSTTRTARSSRSSRAAQTSRCVASESASSSESATSRRRCSSRCRASWSCSHPTGRSATAMPTIRRVGANRAFTKAVVWPDDQLVGRPFLDSSSRTTTGAPPVRSQPQRPGRRRRRSSRSSARQTGARASSRGRPSLSRTSPAGWSGSCSSPAGTSPSASGSRTRTSSSAHSSTRSRTTRRASSASSTPTGVMTENGANIAFERDARVRTGGDRRPGLLGDFVDPAEADEVRDVDQAGSRPERRPPSTTTRG